VTAYSSEISASVIISQKAAIIKDTRLKLHIRKSICFFTKLLAQNSLYIINILNKWKKEERTEIQNVTLMLKNSAVDGDLNEANITQLCEYYLIAHQQTHDQI